jgi:trehalose/maltose hydrolase-like predicted phosphorylase
MPALLSFYPSRAANILRYRYNSLDESNKIARVFGYNGSMFAWTAYVYLNIKTKRDDICSHLDHISVDLKYEK